MSGSLGGKPWAPLSRAWGLRLPITYINSGAQPGPICRPPPHLGSPRQPARARWWLGGVAVRGGPRSPSPHLAPPPTHALQPLVSHPSPQSSTTTPKSKKSDRARHRQLLCSTAAPPPLTASPGPAPRPCSPPPAPILSLDDSHRCAGGLTAEATGPPLPSASQRQRDPRHPPRLGEAGPPRSKASGDHAGFRESSCTAAARSGATQGSREGETDEAV